MPEDLAVNEQGNKLRGYDLDDVEVALTLLARNGGKAYKRTCRQLAEEGRAIDPGALQFWHEESFARRYSEIRLEVQNTISEQAIGQANDIATRSAEGEQIAVERAIEGAGRVDVDSTKDVADMARAARELHQVKRGNIETANLLQGRPTQIAEVRDPDEILKELRALGVVKNEAIDVEAEDVTDDASSSPDLAA